MLRRVISTVIYSHVLFCGLPVSAADKVNPAQDAIDALNDKKALLEAQTNLLKAEADLIKAQNPAFPDNFGKQGSLTIETAERDKFHVTARSAESFAIAAKKLAQLVREEKKLTALISDLDRATLPLYWAEKLNLNKLNSDIESVLGPIPLGKPTPESVGAALFGVGTVLSQLAQFTNLFKTDKNIAFTDSTLPDELLLDMLAVELGETVLYPGGAVDAILTSGGRAFFSRELGAAMARRSELVKLGEKGASVLASLDATTTRLGASDASTKLPLLLAVIRGELVDQYVTAAERILSVKIAVKGGTSLKTSSIWRSDRLYVSGGVVVAYRLTSPEKDGSGKVVRAGVVTEETSFVQVPLK